MKVYKNKLIRQNMIINKRNRKQTKLVNELSVQIMMDRIKNRLAES